MTYLKCVDNNSSLESIFEFCKAEHDLIVVLLPTHCVFVE